MPALLLRFCLRGGALPRFLAAAALVGFSAVGFAAGASAQSPLPPQNFAAEPGDGEITLSWRPPSTENNPGEIFGYRIFSGNLILEIPHLSITSYTLRGLVNYNIGVYTIRAINHNGLGAPAVLTAYSGASAPGAPYADTTDHLLRDSSGQVVASAGVFLGIARASPLGSSTPVPMDSWEFEFSAVGNTWTITTNLTATLATLTVSAGLQGGVLHTIRAIAVNLFGKTRGDAGYFTPPLYAGALLPPPQSVRALGTLNNAAQVHIDQPPARQSPLQYGYWAGAFEGGSLVAAATASVGASEFTLPNLPNGVRYRVEVATHLHGQVGLARATAFADMPPAAPANFVGQHTGGGSIRLSWLPAASPIGLTRYALYAAGEVDELGSGVTVVNVSSGFTGGTVGAYAFTLRAFNGRGGGSFAAATAFVLPPQPPQIAVSRAENRIVVAIEPPAGQASLQHGHWAGAYNGGVLVATATAAASAASLTLRNLPYGVAYRVEAASYLNGQIGLARATASLTMPPAAPANFVGQHIRAGVINFSWQRPVSAVDLHDYVLVSDLGNQIVPAAATTYTYGFNESANPRGVYFFTLFAQSGAGGSAATATVIALSRPQNVIAYGGEGNLVSVTIGPPSGYGHLQHGYWAGAYNGSVLVATATAGVSVTQLTLFNLPNGVAYRVEAAVNLNGHIGLRRAVDDANMPPAAPANFVAQHAGGGAIRLSWLPAASPISLTRYSLYAAGEADELGGGVTVVTVSSSFTGNTVGAYPFTLRAFNGRGSGDFAMATARLLPPPPPLNFTANAAGNNAVSLSWSKNTAGVDPIRYEISYEGALTLNGVTYNGGKGAFTISANAGPSGQYATVVAGLLGHIPYRFAMRAYARGFGGAIHQSAATVVVAAPVSPPDAPSVFAVAGEGLVSLRLTRRGAPPVESFVVRITNVDYLSAWNAGVNIPATQSANFAVTPLFDIYPPSSGDAYTVIVRANNASGAGMPVTITANPLLGAPAAPETVAAAPLPGAASLRWWQNWNHAGGGFINAYIVSWSSGDQSRIVGGNIISGGATIDAAGNIANDASVLSSLVPANRQLSVAGWRSAVVPMPGNAPVTVAIRAHSRSPYSPQNRQLGAPISVVVTTSPALPININTELVSRDNILGEAVLRIHAGAADTSNYPPYYYRIRHFTVGLADENLVADHTVLLANYAPIAPTVLITLYNLASDVRHEFYGQACQIPNCISRSGSRHIALNLPGRVPLPPQSLVATPGNGYVSLSWLPPSTLNNAGELLGYILHNGGARLDLSNPQATSHVFRNLTNFEDVVFQARAVNAAGAGLGATITARVGAPAPGVPLPDPEGDNYLYDENGQVIASAGVFRGIARASPVGAPLPVPTDSWEFEFFRTDLAMYWTVTTNLTAAVAALTVSSGLQGGVEHQIRPIAVNRFGKTYGPLLYFTPRKYSGADLPTPLIFPLALGHEIETHIPDTPYIGIRWRPSTVSSPLNHHYLIEAFSGDNTVTSRVLNRNLVHPELNTPYYPFEYGLQARVELAAYLDGEKGRVTVVTLRTPPTAPFNFSGRYLGQGRISLRWDPATSASTLWLYRVFWEDDEGISRYQDTNDHITFLNLTGFSETPTSRVFRLRAGVVVGGGGVLGPTVSVTVTTPASSPAPRDFSANIADRGVENVLITITWRPPASTDYPPLSYGLWRSNGFSVTLPGDALAYSETVPYGASYSYTIVAYNGADNNLAFAVATVHTPPGRVGNARVAGIEYAAGSGGATARYSIAFDAAPTPLEWTFYYMYMGDDDTSWVKIPGVPQPTPSYFHTNYRNIDDVYVVSIRAFSAAGGGPMAVLTVGGVPRQNYIYSYSAPSGFTAVFNNGGVEFSWDIGSANLGCFGTYSQFQLNGSAPNSHIANIPCSQFNPATRTHHYTIASPGGYGKGGFRLRSRTYSGNQTSPWVTAHINAPPAAPASFSSSPGLNQIALSWRAPASGSQIARYDVFYDNVSISVRLQNPAHWNAGVANFRQSLVVTGLNYDRQYRFTVRAVNAAGAGLSATVTGSPLPLPNVVSFWYRDLTLGGVEVVWVENPVIHTPVLWHELQYNGISLVLGHNAFRREISNLSNGGFHLFTLRLHSAFGAGDTAILSVNMPPGPPKNLAANVGEGLATLRWNAPNWFGNSISYRLKNAGVIGGATLTIASNAVNSFTVFGLSNGGAERFTLWAVSEQGAGETAYLTVNMPPAAPIAQPASGGLNQVTFYWDQSRASATPIYWQELNFLGVRASVGYNITSFPVSGLAKNGATYLASLRAHNAAGAGAYATLTAHTPPTAPVSLTLLAGDGHLTLFWLPPASVVGGSVTAYIGYVNGVPNVTVNGAATIATLTGLTNHVSVTAGLAAQNAVNVGERANFFAAPTDYPPPPAPSLAYFTHAPPYEPDDSGVSVFWSRVGAGFGGAPYHYPIVRYTVEFSGGVTVNGEGFGVLSSVFEQNNAAASAQSRYLKELTGHVPYEFVIRAIARLENVPDGNRYVVGLPKTVTVTPDSKPHTPSVSASGGNGNVTFYIKRRGPAPVDDFFIENAGGGVAVDPYFEQLGIPGITAIAPANVADEITVVFGPLKRDESNNHYFQIRARNYYGDSIIGDANAKVSLGAPDSPASVFVNAAYHSFTLRWWQDPRFEGGGLKEYYFIDYATEGTVGSAQVDVYNNPVTIGINDPGNIFENEPVRNWYSVTITGLAKNGFYTVGIRVRTRENKLYPFFRFISDPPAMATIAPFNLPQAPRELSLAGFNQSVSLAWGPFTVGYDGFHPLLRYELETAGATLTLPGTASVTAIIGLTNGITHSYTMRAFNAFGAGERFTASIFLEYHPPTEPLSLSVQAGNTSLTLHWQTPANDADATITAYILRVNGSLSLTVGGNARALTATTLVNGEYYTLALAGQNTAGIGATATIVGRPLTEPSAPVSLLAQDGDTVITLRWQAPYNGGETITAYIARYSGGGGGGTVTVASTLATLTNIANGDPATIGVFAANTVGEGPGAFVTATAATTPNAPLSLQAADGDTVITLQWQAPYNGGATILGYIVEHTDGTLSVIGGANLSATLTALANGAPITASVFAYNRVDRGAASAPVTATAATIPDAPLSLQAQDGDTVITLQWQAPYNGGAAITAYIVEHTDGTLSVYSPRATLTGLANGAPITASVYAINRVDRGASSAPVTATAATIPNAPLSLQAEDGDTVITLQWQAPYNGGATILGYIIEHTEGTLSVIGGANLSATLTALANGAPITASVFAYNRVDRGAASAPVTATAATIPDAPLSLQAQDGDTVITLQWQAPYNGGAAITAYVVEHTDGTLSVYSPRATLTGLANGAPITASVYAVNRVDRGASSAPVTATAATTPNAPLSLQAEDGDTVITLRWQAPYNGGATILGYVVEHTEGTLSVIGGANLSVTLTGLANGAPITASVYAYNRVARGASSAPVTATAATIPNAPLSLQAQDGDTVITLQWQAPYNGGAAITAYVVEHTDGTLSVFAARATLTGLANGAPITASVYAINRVARGASSAPVTATAATTPSAPLSLQAQDGDDGITLQWQEPYNGGAAIFGYIVEHSHGALSVASPLVTITGIANGVAITASVYAINRVGNGAASAPVTATAAAPPSAPLSLQAQDNDRVISLQWQAPANDGGAVVTGYIVEHTEGTLRVAGGANLSAALTGLVNGAPITASVYAINRVRRGAASAPITATAATTPNAPAAFYANEGSGVITLGWQYPLVDGGATVTLYLLQHSEGGVDVDVPTNRDNVVRFGLVNGVTVAFTLRAQNRKGLGLQTVIYAAPRGIPGKPPGLTAEEGEGLVLLRWNAAPPNGRPVTLYHIAHNGITQTAAGLEATVSGLDNGVTTGFTLRGQNSVGIGLAATITATPRSVPGEPARLRAFRGNAVVTLYWNAPPQLNGSTVTGYVAQYDGMAQTMGVNVYSLVVSNLLNGTRYAFSVFAQSDRGDGLAATASALPATIPDAPLSLRAQDGNGVVTLSWQAPYNGGEVITAYIARYVGGGGGGAVTVASTVATLTGVANGAPLTASVYAVNAVDRGDYSAPVVATAATTPNAPLSLQAQDGDRVITLQWQAPYNGGATILGYIVEHTEGTLSVSGGANLGVTLTGLVNGAPITASVYAINRVSRGASSAPVTATAATTPNAPLSLQAQDGDTVITLQWRLPYNGGATILGYIVEHTEGTLSVSGGANLSVTLTGLANGAPITASVYAINRVSRGASSAPVTATAATTPNAPISLQAQDGDTVITLQWQAPYNGGATILGYVVEHTEGTLSVSGGANLSVTLTGLANGAPITASVYAINRVSRGASSAPVTATAAATASAPTAFAAFEGDTVVTLRWGAPADDGGAAVTLYLLQHSEGTVDADVLTNRDNVVRFGLVNGVTVAFTLRAINRKGASAPTIIYAAPRGKPGAPASVTATEGAGFVVLQWSAAPPNGRPVTLYHIAHNGVTQTAAGLAATVSALTSGETVAFVLRGQNSVGIGAPATITATPRSVPGLPVGLSPTRGDAAVTLAWGAPPPNGSTITGYVAQYNGQAQTLSGAGHVGVTLTGLTNGVLYTIGVYAQSDRGNGATAQVTARPARVPFAPLSLTAADGDEVITLQWQAPNNGGEPILQYIVESNGAPTLTLTTTLATLTGLVNGAGLSLQVAARNVVGLGAAGAAVFATAAKTASEPTAFGANEGEGVVTLFWGYPTNDGGATVSLYVMEHRDVGQDVVTVKTPHNNVVRFALQNGVTVAFTLWAQNRKGLSGATVLLAAPRGKPGAPTGITASEGAGVVVLRWNAAAANGRPVTLYYVSYNNATLTTAGEAATVSNLVNGATVAFTLWAQNSVGIGASATAMAAARSVPSVPSSLQAQRGDGVVTLLWALPADLNGASVTGYVAEYAGESQTLGGNVYSVVVGNLQNGVNYAFSVYAQSDRGDGLPAVASARPARVPFAPLSLVAADSDGVVTLQWQAPNNGGEPITAYVARYAGAGGGAVTVASTVATLTGLANGAPITASVYALNVVGAGGASPPTTATAARVANAPTSLRVNEGEGVITLLWDSPANGGAAITAYIAAHAGETITANANSVIFANLPSGETLAFSVVALNRKGRGAAAFITAAAHGKPGAPASLRATRGNGLVTLTWNAPTRLNGSQLYGYGVAYNGQTQSVGASATGYTATGLTNGTEYEFSVFAKSDYGDGATATTSAKPATTPATPASLRAYFADSAITLQWALVAGADAGGESVTAYIIRYGANQALTAAATATSAVFANLTNGETIAFSVYAVNTVGESATPATISEYASTTPNAPTGLLAQDGNGVITLQWSAPVNNGGAAITAYIVERAGGALTTGAPAATLTGLTNGEAIAMTVYAVNRAGVGAASAPATATAATTPAAPVSLLAAEGDAEVTLQWGAPANGGAAILGYTLQWLGQSAPAEERSFVVGNLTNGETVRFTVFAHNRKGAGAVATVAAAGRGKPGAPANVTATEGAGFVVLQWSAAPANGRPVTLYRIAYNGGSVAAAGLSVAISSLTNGEAVAFTLRGQNSVGIGAAATITATPRAAPGAPLNLRAQRGNAVVTLSWSMPGLLNGATITGYVVDYGDAAQTLSGAGRVGVTLFGLLNGVLYNIGVYAQSDRGVGATASVMARPATTPAAPVSLRAADGDGVVTLQWLAPNNGGEPILRYVVESGGAPTLTVATTLATLTGLTNGEPITAGVYAENVEGAGARAASVVATAASAPAAPTAFVAFEGDEVVTLYWGYPANDGGASVTAYLLEHQGLSVLTQHDNVTRFALENGVTVAFTLRAQNRKGFGEAAVFYAAPRGKPGAPRNLTANEGEMQIILRWDSAPANGREVTLYYIAYNGASITTANDAATISPLTNGIAVAFTLRAQNSVGIGEAATITATPRSVPGAPANLQTQRGNGVVTLLWGAPMDLNGATVTGYVVEYAGLAHTLSAGNTGWTASALQNGTRYAFTVYAQSNLGNGLAAVRRATPATTPAAPFGLAAADGNGVVTLNWQAPNNGGEPITAFVAQYVGGGGGGAATVASTAAVLTGIANGAPITASIYAVNAVGAGAPSAPIVATAATTPNAPLGLRAGEGEGQVTLFWNAPNNGGATITAYIASHAGETKTVSGNSAVFAGLTNGETVVFAARAINRKGQSAPASLAAAARGKPGAPTNLLADEGEMQIVLRWSAAAANGAAVTLYRIAYNGQTQTAENLEATIGGLSNGIAVAFTLRGQNSVGIGAAATITATPRTVPGAPANLQAQRGNRAVTLSWGAPAQLNGAAVTGYVVEYAGAAQTLSGGGVTGWVASGLQNGLVYSFTVYAQSDQGAGLAAVASAKPATTPAAPTGLTAADGDAVITLQWLAPASGGEDILEYVAVYIDAGGGGAVTAASTMATLTGLINGEPVIASVYAVNAVGAGAGSSPVAATAARVPSFVLSLRAAEGDTVATLLWNAPQSNGGAAITAYYVVGGGQTLRARQTRATITGLRNGVTAAFTVRAVNRKGAGATRAVSLAGRGKPDAPANFVAQGADGYAALSWDAAAANGASVTAYLLAHNGATQTIVALSATVGGLVNGETTRFTLRAQNSVGIGAAAVAVAAPSGAPGAPTSLRAQRGDSVVRLMWQPPTQLNGATVTGYVVSASHSGGAQTLAATARTAVFGTLQNGVDYTFAVYAQSNRGNGAQANVEERPATTPGVPRDITARFGDGEITLQWRAPASNGGEALTAYIVEYNNRVTSFAAGVTVAKIDNLQNGVTFNFSVYAANIVGKGRDAAQVSEYPSGAPPAVLLLTAVFGDGQIALQWRPPPTNNGATITAYYVERLGQPALKTQTTMATVGSLQNGVSYVFFVYGVNRAGEGAVAVIDEYPSAAPASPVNFVAMHEGGTRLTLQWEEPNDNGDDIARYVAHYQGQTLILSKNSRALTLDVAGRGEELAFTLYAHNRAGRGAAAMANKHATNAPSAPVGLQAQRGDRAVTLLWQAPAQINGATISAYIVEYNGASQTAAANANGITITALQNGVEYAFAVYASSDNGNGATATANATPMSAPSVPQSLTAARGNAQVSLDWLAPSDNGGSAIAAYIVSWRKDSQQTTPAENRRETTALAITIGALENGEVYWFSVRARNAAGLEGEWTPQQQAKPARAPDAPQNFGYLLNDETAEVTLQWIAPDDGGEPLTAYILHFGSVGAQAADISIRNLPPTQTSFVFAINPNLSYAASIYAVNTAGQSPAAVLRMDGLPSVPQNLTAARGDRQVVLNWLAPAYDGGSNIAAYIVSWRKDSQQTTPAGNRRETTALAITISPLENGEVYWFSVRARNEATLTGAATPQQQAKPGRAPDAPQNFGYMRNDETAEVTLQWNAPRSNGGEPLTAYILHFGSVGAAAADISVRSLPPTQHSLVLAIDLSLSYAASLYAANTVGPSRAAVLRVNPLNSLEEKAGAAHNAVLGAAAAALAGNWTGAIGRRLSGGGGGQGGGGFSFAVPGANFGIGGNGGGGAGAGANNAHQFAALLRKHGEALAGGDFAAASAINGASFAFAATDANGKPQWDVWGGGGYTDLEHTGNDANWRGRNRSYYGGIDKSAVVKGKQARLGIMFSYDDMDIRMTLDEDAVGYRLHAAGAHPYFSWHFNENTRAYVAAGQGRGEARITVENSGSVTQNLIIRHAAAGLRRKVRAWQDKAGGRVDLGVAADAGIVRADIQGGDGFNSSNLLLSFDAKHRVALAGGEFSQYGKAGLKYEGRPVGEAFGWQASFGGRYAFAAGWSLQSDFNMSHLRARDGSKDRQWGWSGMAELPAAANGGGWSFSLRPAYGATGAGGGIGGAGDMAQGLWKQTTPTATASAPRAFSLRSELGYGILGKNALYTPYAGLAYDGIATLRAGIRWEQRRHANMSARANMEVTRSENSAAAAKIRLQANY